MRAKELSPQHRGARTRLANLSAERRREIGRLAAIKRWTRIPIVPRANKDDVVRYWCRALGLDL